MCERGGGIWYGQHSTFGFIYLFCELFSLFADCQKFQFLFLITGFDAYTGYTVESIKTLKKEKNSCIATCTQAYKSWYTHRWAGYYRRYSKICDKQTNATGIKPGLWIIKNLVSVTMLFGSEALERLSREIRGRMCWFTLETTVFSFLNCNTLLY